MQAPAPCRATVHKRRSHKISLTCVWIHHVRSLCSAKDVAARANHRAAYVQVSQLEARLENNRRREKICLLHIQIWLYPSASLGIEVLRWKRSNG